MNSNNPSSNSNNPSSTPPQIPPTKESPSFAAPAAADKAFLDTDATAAALQVEEAAAVEKKVEEAAGDDHPMDAAGDGPPPALAPATVFRVRLKQPLFNLRHKMSVPELCRNFSAVAWCGKLNAIACASETCARIPSSNANPPFWIPIHIINPERPTECALFNVKAVHKMSAAGEKEEWWIGRWVHGCPMCGGTWVRVV